MKKTHCFLFLGVLLASAGSFAVFKNSNSFLAKGAGTSKWKHFESVEATYDTRGIKEYWTDCIGGAPVFEAPADVEVSEGGIPNAEFIKSLDLFDERVMPAYKDYKELYALKAGEVTYKPSCAVASTTEQDPYYGTVRVFDFSSVSGNSEAGAMWGVAPAMSAEFADKTANVYIYPEKDMTITYTNGATWAPSNFEVKANQWNKITIDSTMASKTAIDYFKFVASSADALKELGKVKVSSFTAPLSKEEVITPANFYFQGLTKQVKTDETVGSYYEVDLSNYSDTTATQIHFATMNSIDVKAMAGRKTELYIYLENKDANAKVFAQENLTWGGPQINPLEVEKWNKITFEPTYLATTKDGKTISNIYLYLASLSDTTIKDIGVIRVSFLHTFVSK